MPSVPKPVVHRQRKRFAARRDPVYTDWIRSHPCLLRGLHVCIGLVQVCHMQSRGAGGNDRGNCIPMCLAGHDEQHHGTRTFERKYGIDLREIAMEYYDRYLRVADELCRGCGSYKRGDDGCCAECFVEWPAPTKETACPIQ